MANSELFNIKQLIATTALLLVTAGGCNPDLQGLSPKKLNRKRICGKHFPSTSVLPSGRLTSGSISNVYCPADEGQGFDAQLPSGHSSEASISGPSCSSLQSTSTPSRRLRDYWEPTTPERSLTKELDYSHEVCFLTLTSSRSNTNAPTVASSVSRDLSSWIDNAPLVSESKQLAIRTQGNPMKTITTETPRRKKLAKPSLMNVGERCPGSDEVCSKLLNCLSRVRILKNLKETNKTEFRSYYDEIWCGKEDEEDLICCDTPVETLVTEDVSQHPNLYLLRQDICGPISQDRIYNGKKARLFEFPWMVIPIKMRWFDSQQNCGASLISDRYVLTAAHCIEQMVPNYVILGEHHMQGKIDCEENCDGEKICAPKPQDIPVEEVVVHPNYLGRSTPYNDIALLRLSHPADLSSDAVRPVCLPIGLSQQRLNLTGKMVDIAGWGLTEKGKKSDELLKATIRVLNHNKCQFWPPVSTVAHICAGGGIHASDACHGDSGGPLTYVGEVNGSIRSLQYGIVSFGSKKCGSPGIGEVFTHVGHYMKWILDNMKP